MKTELRLKLVAAAISITLGSAAAYAQPDTQQRTQDSERSQDLSRQQESQQEGGQRQQDSSQRAAERAQQPSDQRQATGSGGIEQLAAEHDDLTVFVEALETTGLADSLTAGSEYTVFAPTNDAFESMEGRSVEELQRSENREELTGLLRAHIVADDLDQEMARTIGRAQTVDGGAVDVSMQDGELMVGGATAQAESIQVGNLRVYRIDSVLPSDPGASLAEGGRLSEQDQQPRGESDADSGSVSASGQYPPFEEVDRNSDGQISRAELAMVEGLEFATADEDQNGQLNRQEYQQAAEE